MSRKDNRPEKGKTLNRILNIITAVLIAAAVFLIAVLVIDRDTDYHISYMMKGNSMDPTITNDAVVVWVDPAKAPFDELKVGDIIAFQERADINTATSGIVFRIHPAEDGGHSTLTIENNDAGSVDDRDGNIEYVPGENIMHRIVEIREPDSEHDRALTTRGDNNPVNDSKLVLESGYVGKVVWHANHMGLVFKLLYTDRMIYAVEVLAAVMLGIVLIRQFVLKKDEVT